MEKTIIAKRKNKVIYVEGQRCFKVFEPGYNKGFILNEALNQARVEETDLHIPKLLEVKMIDGCWAIVMQHIEGQTLEMLMKQHPEQEDEYLSRFVDLQIEMQTKKCPLLSKYRDKMNRKIDDLDLNATMRYDLHNRIESMPRHNYLCHGDYTPSNVIIDEKGDAYIIDWSHVTQGNRAADAAKSYLIFLKRGEKALARKYLDCYCEKTGLDYHLILSWLPMIAATDLPLEKERHAPLLNRLIFLDEEGLEELYAEV